MILYQSPGIYFSIFVGLKTRVFKPIISKKRSLGINIMIYCVLYLYCTLHLFVDCILCTVYFILYLLAVFQTTLYCTYWPCFRPFCFCRFVAWLCFKPSPCASVETILGVVFWGPSGPKTILGLVFRPVRPPNKPMGCFPGPSGPQTILGVVFRAPRALKQS